MVVRGSGETARFSCSGGWLCFLPLSFSFGAKSSLIAAMQLARLSAPVVALVFLLLGGTPAAFADPALKKVSLLLDWYPEAENAGYFYALTHGLYAKAGLDVEISPKGPNASVGPQVALGKYDFGLDSSDEVLIARARGIPLVMLMGAREFAGAFLRGSGLAHGSGAARCAVADVRD
jgi:ABC-type nitrate/sulfonate/bicarbonate transport system substrate-binding protein